jgi:thymidylate synthase (FAD)
MQKSAGRDKGDNKMKQTHEVELKWATPNGDQLIGHMARVSNSNAQPEDDASKLISYLIHNRHWSPFEMVNMCVEIRTTRDVGRQILRHRSFSFQEFSGRYAEYDSLDSYIDIRMQDLKNRQSSLPAPEAIAQDMESLGHQVGRASFAAYTMMLELGVAKEVARRVLPEGMVPTKMYMNGTVRSWIHYIKERTEMGVQREHRIIAGLIAGIFTEQFPDVATASGVAA